MPQTPFNPTPEQQTKRAERYDHLEIMRKLKETAMPHFAGPNGNRSFNTYIDDSERILNGYTLSREAQGKEDWQSNMMDNITLAKLRATANAVGLKVPDMRFEASNTSGVKSWIHADLLKNITRKTFQEGNPTLHNFLEIWMMMSHGGLIEYEGYKTGGAKQKRVKSFDSVTGEVETVTEYVKYDSKPYSVVLNPQEFFFWSWYHRDVQDQPRVAWVQHYSKMELEREFSKYPNYKYALDKKSSQDLSSRNDSLYYDKWAERVQSKDDFEIVRYYSKADDCYAVYANGVPLIDAPLLWGEQDKYYPFAKSISNPFANPNFFWGMSLPAILEAYQDTKNTVANTMVDKLYRSMETPLLVGLQNKDLLDWETESVSKDNRIYVPDINAVREMPINGVNQGELAMLQMLDRGIDSLSVDKSQQGMQSSGNKTAKEITVADDRAREQKAMLYLFLEDLWLQKTRLRVKNILTHLLKDKAASKDIREQIISISDYKFPSGEQGTLDVHIADSPAKMLSPVNMDARTDLANQIGDVYKIVSILKTIFEEWKIDCYVIPESFHQQERNKQEQDLMSEIQRVTTLFPEFFVANKDHYLGATLALSGKSIDDYNPPAPLAPAPQDPAAAGQDPNAASPLQEGMTSLPASNIIQ